MLLLLLTKMMMTTIPMAGSTQHYWLPLLLMVYLRRNQLCQKVSSSGPKVPGWSSFPPSFWVFCPVKKSWELVWYIYSSIFRSYYINPNFHRFHLAWRKKKTRKKFMEMCFCFVLETRQFILISQRQKKKFLIMIVERERDVYPHFILEEIENNRWW
jgi:hypothetical protein